MSDLTETIPDVEFPYPPCPLCDEDLDHDDGWYCQHCEVSWHENGTYGEHYGVPSCGAKQHADVPPRTGRPPDPPSPVCLLDEGHSGDHSGRGSGGRGWVRWGTDKRQQPAWPVTPRYKPTDPCSVCEDTGEVFQHATFSDVTCPECSTEQPLEASDE